MNLIKIRNTTSNRIRLFQIPDNLSIAAGVLCEIPFGSSTTYGITVCDSWLEDEAGVAIIRNALNLPADGEFKKVIAAYAKTTMVYPQPAEEDDEAEADPELNTACVEDNDTEEAEG